MASYYQISMSVAVFHVVKCVLTHWAASSVAVTVDIQWMTQGVMVSNCIMSNIITLYC